MADFTAEEMRKLANLMESAINGGPAQEQAHQRASELASQGQGQQSEALHEDESTQRTWPASGKNHDIALKRVANLNLMDYNGSQAASYNDDLDIINPDLSDTAYARFLADDGYVAGVELVHGLEGADIDQEMLSFLQNSLMNAFK